MDGFCDLARKCKSGEAGMLRRFLFRTPPNQELLASCVCRRHAIRHHGTRHRVLPRHEMRHGMLRRALVRHGRRHGKYPGRATACCCGMGVACGSAAAARAYYRCPVSPIRGETTSTVVSTAFDVSSSTSAAEAMLTPAVAISPVRPWAHAQEDAAIEITRPIIATGCASVRRIAIVAVGTYGWS
jgi:hypothetical protein